jgi:hypothetical protein
MAFVSCSPTPPTTRSHICAYVRRIKENVSRNFEMRHVIHDIRFSSGQWPRCDVTYGAVRWPRSYEINGNLDIYMSKNVNILLHTMVYFASIRTELHSTWGFDILFNVLRSPIYILAII